MKKLLKAIKNFVFPPYDDEFVGYVITKNGGMRLEYSSEEALYKRFQRQFDAANELAELQRQGKLPK